MVPVSLQPGTAQGCSVLHRSAAGQKSGDFLDLRDWTAAEFPASRRAFAAARTDSTIRAMVASASGAAITTASMRRQ
jgi:hypothetical protein